MRDLTLFESRAHESELLTTCIRRKAGAAPLRILEAGCGREWPLRLAGIAHTVTGVDVDGKALRFRRRAGDLDEAILGDLRSLQLVEASYDVIYSSFVLEHVAGAEQVLSNFARWLKSGGLLILRIPDRYSVYGFVARSTPFWFHVFYKKYVEGIPTAGQPGFDPYPTVHDPVISRQGVHDFAATHGFAIRAEHGQGYYLQEKDAKTWLIRPFVISAAALSFGRLKWRHNNLTYVLEKA